MWSLLFNNYVPSFLVILRPTAEESQKHLSNLEILRPFGLRMTEKIKEYATKIKEEMEH